jgi:hypothetical protein
VSPGLLVLRVPVECLLVPPDLALPVLVLRVRVRVLRGLVLVCLILVQVLGLVLGLVLGWVWSWVLLRSRVRVVWLR